jgi:DNA-binding CsgD family transcriptional regulator
MTVRKTLGPPPVGDGPLPELSRNERTVLEASAQGATYGAIARKIGITEKAVGNIAMRVVSKMGAKSITHAVYLGCRTGLLPVDLPRPRETEVLAAPSIRLIRSLMAEGFSLSFIAQQMGMGQPELSVLMNRVHITPATAARVQGAFAELAGRDPLKAGVHPRGRTRALNRARAEGWEIVPADEQARLRGTHINAA